MLNCKVTWSPVRCWSFLTFPQTIRTLWGSSTTLSSRPAPSSPPHRTSVCCWLRPGSCRATSRRTAACLHGNHPYAVRCVHTRFHCPGIPIHSFECLLVGTFCVGKTCCPVLVLWDDAHKWMNKKTAGVWVVNEIIKYLHDIKLKCSYEIKDPVSPC